METTESTIQVAENLDKVGDYETRHIPFVWFDDRNDPANPGWVLRHFNEDDWSDEILAADNPDNPDEAVTEATKLARVAGLI